MKLLLDKLALLLRQRLRDSRLAKIALAVSIVVVFCTTYALVLPALTLSNNTSSSVLQTQESSSETPATEKEQASQSSATEASHQATESKASQAESTPDESYRKAGSLSSDTDDVTVKVDYEADTFAEKVNLKVTPITNSQALTDKIQQVLDDSKQSLLSSYSYDISLKRQHFSEQFL